MEDNRAAGSEWEAACPVTSTINGACFKAFRVYFFRVTAVTQI